MTGSNRNGVTSGGLTPLVSVVIAAHNPPLHHMSRVIAALRAQTMPLDQWELILVDDGSRDAVEDLVDLSWHPRGRFVATSSDRKGIGLVGARLKGFESGVADIFVFVDQDNALRSDYLSGALEIASEYPWLGAWGGQIKLEFDDPARAPEQWLWPMLGTRRLDQDIWSNDVRHYDSTPWGAGLCVRRDVLRLYREKVDANPLRRRLDPWPEGMGFGGDTDLVNAGCGGGFGKGAFVRLHLDHLMPIGRCTDEHFLKKTEAMGYSEVLHEFIEHGLVRPPRTDLRFWFMTALRWPRMKRLERRMLLRNRRGRYAAVSEFEGLKPDSTSR
jgi:glycosyltransferase involved in cell wall biosynthesis